MGIEDIIPKVAGFAPLPLSIMAPFMAYQSAQMAFAFGFDYEKGKRTLKSMSNEEFNTLTAEQEQNLFAQNHGVLLQTFINEIPKSDLVQKLVLDKLVELEFKKVEMNIRLIHELPSEYLKQLVEIFGSASQGSGIDALLEYFKSLTGTVTTDTIPTITTTPTTTAIPTSTPELTSPSSGETILYNGITYTKESAKAKISLWRSVIEGYALQLAGINNQIASSPTDSLIAKRDSINKIVNEILTKIKSLSVLAQLIVKTSTSTWQTGTRMTLYKLKR